MTPFRNPYFTRLLNKVFIVVELRRTILDFNPFIDEKLPSFGMENLKRSLLFMVKYKACPFEFVLRKFALD